MIRFKLIAFDIRTFTAGEAPRTLEALAERVRTGGEVTVEELRRAGLPVAVPLLDRMNADGRLKATLEELFPAKRRKDLPGTPLPKKPTSIDLMRAFENIIAEGKISEAEGRILNAVQQEQAAEIQEFIVVGLVSQSNNIRSIASLLVLGYCQELFSSEWVQEIVNTYILPGLENIQPPINRSDMEYFRTLAALREKLTTEQRTQIITVIIRTLDRKNLDRVRSMAGEVFAYSPIDLEGFPKRFGETIQELESLKELFLGMLTAL